MRERIRNEVFEMTTGVEQQLIHLKWGAVRTLNTQATGHAEDVVVTCSSTPMVLRILAIVSLLCHAFFSCIRKQTKNKYAYFLVT